MEFTWCNVLTRAFVVSIVIGAPMSVSAGYAEDCDDAEQLLSSDPSRAVSACRHLAEEDVAKAQFKLATMYDKGEGVPLDDIEAVKWYRRAAN